MYFLLENNQTKKKTIGDCDGSGNLKDSID